MKTYNVTIDFKRGPSFGGIVEAPDEDAALARTLEFARRCDYTEAVKRSTITEEVTA